MPKRFIKLNEQQKRTLQYLQIQHEGRRTRSMVAEVYGLKSYDQAHNHIKVLANHELIDRLGRRGTTKWVINQNGRVALAQGGYYVG